MKRIIPVCALLLAISSSAGARDSEGISREGCDAALVIDNRSTGARIDVNPELGGRRLPPCSTFKMYNTLIGLELGLLTGPDAPWYRWDGVVRDIDGWNRDLSLREAFRVSAVPAYQNLARQIGPARMKEYVERIGYGSRDISSGVDFFWLPRPGRTPISISAREQVELLHRLLDNELPFASQHVDVLRSIMEVSRTERGTLYGKTGSGTDEHGSPNLGWFVGFLESGGTTYVFACAVTAGQNPSGTVARKIVSDFFVSQGLL